MRSQSHRSLPRLGSALRVLNGTSGLATTSWGNPGEEDGLVQRPAAPLVSMQDAQLNT
jgi:hypothetical protein